MQYNIQHQYQRMSRKRNCPVDVKMTAQKFCFVTSGNNNTTLETLTLKHAEESKKGIKVFYETLRANPTKIT